jgi:hypothetical protein
MLRVFAKRAYRFQVKALNVKEGAKKSRLEHGNNLARNSAGRKASLYVFLNHHLLHIASNGERHASCTGLEGEAIDNESSRGKNFRGGGCDVEPDRVFVASPMRGTATTKSTMSCLISAGQAG